MCGVLFFALLLFLGHHKVVSIKLSELRVPAHAAAGTEALFGCQFELEGELLYSVKWYKDGKEFFRYIPKNHPQQMAFDRPGVTVDLSKSSSNVITLVELTPESAGLYRCEVSGEAPRFVVAADEKYVTIHVLPKTYPQITGLQEQYQIGDLLSANCTCPGSRPEAQLKWLINNRPAGLNRVKGPWLRVVQDPPDTMETTLGLSFFVIPSHFRKGVLHIKCQATLAPLYQRETFRILHKTEPPTEPSSDFEPDIVPDGSSIADYLAQKQIEKDILDHLKDKVDFDTDSQETTTTIEPHIQGIATLTKKSTAVMFLTLFIQIILLI